MDSKWYLNNKSQKLFKPPGNNSLKLVTAAKIKEDGLYLVARQRKGLRLAGYCEFPGGKEEITTLLS